MNCRERENLTLSFTKLTDRGAVEETFFPWGLTVNRWKTEGLPEHLADNLFKPEGKEVEKVDRYLNCLMADDVYNYEQYLGFDGVKRMAFRIPFKSFDKEVLEETLDYVLRLDEDGWQRKYFKNSELVQEVKPVVSKEEDWSALKERAIRELETYCTDENIEKIYSVYKEGHEKGDYPIRFRLSGFFWTPRELLGIEKHMLAFYDYPEMIHDINEFVLQSYMDRMDKILDILPADVILFEEDLSGKNGPMLSPGLFDEFVGAYYKRLVPFLKEKGVKNVFVDTDGDFNILIPNFIESGIDGFLPMDVNAGMDIVEVRKNYPDLKFIGAFNKLEIAKGKEAIDAEFERLMPVIGQGGYIPGCDHQVAPSTPFKNYKYYISRLKEAMKQAGKGLR